MPCYELETLTFKNPAFKKVGLSVLITMHDSTRRRQYMDQLERYRPTKTVIILHNKGFKNCKKPGVRTSVQDLWHANLMAARIANYDSVLILEDDVEFLTNFRNDVSAVEKFWTRVHGPCAYNLGSLVHISLPCTTDHIRVILGGMTQAVLYNREATKRFPSIRVMSIPHDLKLSWTIKTYVYWRALTFQKLVETENSHMWNVAGIPMLIQKGLLGMGSSQQAFINSHNIAPAGGTLPYIVLYSIILLVLISRMTRAK